MSSVARGGNGGRLPETTLKIAGRPVVGRDGSEVGPRSGRPADARGRSGSGRGLGRGGYRWGTLEYG